jgi:hypothetical protein
MDPHLTVAGKMMNPRLSTAQRLQAALRAGLFYMKWYPKQYLPTAPSTAGLDKALKPHLRYVAKTSRKLARRMLHNMFKYGPKLEREQMLLSRFVDIGTELFALAASTTRAQALIEKGEDRTEVLSLVNHFAAHSRLKVAANFKGFRKNNDRMGYRLAQRMLEGPPEWLVQGVVGEMKPQLDPEEHPTQKVMA